MSALRREAPVPRLAATLLFARDAPLYVSMVRRNPRGQFPSSIRGDGPLATGLQPPDHT